MLSNLERRVVGNLSIPRNPVDLAQMIRSDIYAGAPEFDAHNTRVLVGNRVVYEGDILRDLAKRGLVVSLGKDHESSGKLAAAADKHAKALSMPDEKARIFERRLLTPHRRWRGRGEQWIMTAEGFDALHDPESIGDPTPLPTAVVEQMIAQEFARVHKGSVKAFANPDHDVTLGDKLLEEEFVAWAKSVADAHEEATGERPHLPIAGGAGYADATEVLIIDPENGKGTAYTETAPWFMAATTVAVTDADTGSTITEAAYTGYARKSVAAADMNAAASPGGSATNANAITFAPCTGGTAAVIGFAKCVAATVGRLIKYGTCATVNVSSTQQPLNFAAAAFSTSLD